MGFNLGNLLHGLSIDELVGVGSGYIKHLLNDGLERTKGKLPSTPAPTVDSAAQAVIDTFDHNTKINGTARHLAKSHVESVRDDVKSKGGTVADFFTELEAAVSKL